jgi:endoglucanase
LRGKSLDFLKQLVETPSPSGFEQAAQRLFRQYVAPFADAVETDVLGNAIAARNPEGSPRVMLAGHCDQIGLIVTHIDDDGFVYFRRIGGLDPAACVSQRVIIQGREGPVPGVVGRKAIHLQDASDRNKAPKLEDLWVDIGAKDRKDAEQRVRVGDPGVFVQPFELLPNERAVSMAFDNKMAVWLVAETLRLLSQKKHSAAVYGVATVQEEIGSIGARTSAFRVEPDLAVVIDVGHATDHPGLDKKKEGDFRLGCGPILSRGANVNPRVFEMLEATAGKHKIPYQTEGIGGRSATDADPIQYSRAGVAVGLIHVPLRYMHTPCELISLEDLTNTAKLLAAFVQELKPGTSFIPE